MTAEPTAQDVAKESDDSPAERVEGDDADQQECEHHAGCAALPVAVSPSNRDLGDADQKRNGEGHAPRLGEPKPPAEPPPIASESRHASSLGRRTIGILGRSFRDDPESDIVGRYVPNR
jgi:hypothetical protein